MVREDLTETAAAGWDHFIDQHAEIGCVEPYFILPRDPLTSPTTPLDTSLSFHVADDTFNQKKPHL